MRASLPKPAHRVMTNQEGTMSTYDEGIDDLDPDDLDRDVLELDPNDPEAPADNEVDPETIAHLDPDEEVPASGELPPDPTGLGALD